MGQWTWGIAQGRMGRKAVTAALSKCSLISYQPERFQDTTVLLRAHYLLSIINKHLSALCRNMLTVFMDVKWNSEVTNLMTKELRSDSVSCLPENNLTELLTTLRTKSEDSRLSRRGTGIQPLDHNFFPMLSQYPVLEHIYKAWRQIQMLY